MLKKVNHSLLCPFECPLYQIEIFNQIMLQCDIQSSSIVCGRAHSTKAIYGPKSSGGTILLSADGSTLLIDKEAIMEGWADHFNSVLVY